MFNCHKYIDNQSICTQKESVKQEKEQNCVRDQCPSKHQTLIAEKMDETWEWYQSSHPTLGKTANKHQTIV